MFSLTKLDRLNTNHPHLTQLRYYENQSARFMYEQGHFSKRLMLTMHNHWRYHSVQVIPLNWQEDTTVLQEDPSHEKSDRLENMRVNS
jgi:hypothetical protein